MKIDWPAHATTSLTMRPEQTLEETYERMFGANAHFAAVLDAEGRVLGLVAFRTLASILSAKYGQALYNRRPIGGLDIELKMSTPGGGTELQRLIPVMPREEIMVLAHDTDFFAAQETFNARPERHYFDDIVVVGGDGKYLGLLSVREFNRLQYRVLHGQKAEIESKNEQILDSINYAVRIQQAMLATDAKLWSAGCQRFIFFLPRDIVSGDFYWFHDLGDALMVAVVDCTGHGVPGAFMSLIGHSLLEQIVKHDGVKDPGEVLTRMHEQLQRRLHQDGGRDSSHDGMDVCLVLVPKDPGAGFVAFAGARRPLYTVDRNGILAEVKGSRRSIGGRQREERRVFTTEKVPAGAGTSLFLTSDGFADQPDPAGRKFGLPALRSLFREAAGLSDSAERRERVAAALRSHAAAEPQRDDITVVGLELAA